MISGPITINKDNNEFKKYLEFLFKNLEQNAPFIKDIIFINKTKVPIIKIKTTEEYYIHRVSEADMIASEKLNSVFEKSYQTQDLSKEGKKLILKDSRIFDKFS